MRVWRCVHERFIRDAWSGEGARRFGGRWNPPGRRMVYASEHAALAVLEVMVGGVAATDLKAWRLVSATLPGKVPLLASEGGEQERGAAFLDSGGLAVAVSSVVVPGTNILLNPDAQDWHRLAFYDEAPLDPRLWM